MICYLLRDLLTPSVSLWQASVAAFVLLVLMEDLVLVTIQTVRMSLFSGMNGLNSMVPSVQ
jgi:hypothetical protein